MVSSYTASIWAEVDLGALIKLLEIKMIHRRAGAQCRELDILSAETRKLLGAINARVTFTILMLITKYILATPLD